jgi:hypothetical protein
MSFGSTTQHHANIYHGWDTSDDDYQVYESTVVEAAPPMPAVRFTGHHGPSYHPNAPVEYNNDYDYDYEERRVVEAPRGRVVEYEYVATQHAKPAHHHHAHIQNVDKEAGEFIKLEHKKFELRKLMSF